MPIQEAQKTKRLVSLADVKSEMSGLGLNNLKHISQTFTTSSLVPFYVGSLFINMLLPVFLFLSMIQPIHRILFQVPNLNSVSSSARATPTHRTSPGDSPRTHSASKLCRWSTPPEPSRLDPFILVREYFARGSPHTETTAGITG